MIKITGNAKVLNIAKNNVLEWIVNVYHMDNPLNKLLADKKEPYTGGAIIRCLEGNFGRWT